MCGAFLLSWKMISGNNSRKWEVKLLSLFFWVQRKVNQRSLKEKHRSETDVCWGKMTSKCLKAIGFHFCWSFLKARVTKCRLFFFLVAKMGVIVQDGPNGKRGNWGRELNRVLILQEQQLQNAVVCKESFCFCLSDHCPRILWLES